MSLSFWCWCHIRFICLFEPISQSILQVTVASPCTNFLGGILGHPRDPIRFTLGPCLPLNHPGHRGIIGASSGPLGAVSGHPRAILWPYRGILGVCFQGSGSADCPSISDLPHKQAGDVSRRPTATLLHSTCCCTTFHCDPAAVDVHVHVVAHARLMIGIVARRGLASPDPKDVQTLAGNRVGPAPLAPARFPLTLRTFGGGSPPQGETETRGILWPSRGLLRASSGHHVALSGHPRGILWLSLGVWVFLWRSGPPRAI